MIGQGGGYRAGGSVGGGFTDVWKQIEGLDQSTLAKMQAAIRQNPYLAELFNSGGGGGRSRDPFTGRFQGQFRPGAMPPANASGAATAEYRAFLRDSHQMAVDIHKLTMAVAPGGGNQHNVYRFTNQRPGPPSGYMPPRYGQGPYGWSAPMPSAGPYGWGYGSPVYGAGSPGGGFFNAPPRGAPPPPPPPRGGGRGYGGGYGGGGHGGGWGSGLFGPRGPVAGYGLLRGLMVGRLAIGAGEDIVKDAMNPARLAAEMQQAYAAAALPFVRAGKPYYALGTAGGFSGKEAFSRLAPQGAFNGSYAPAPWMSHFGVTNADIAGAFQGFGIAPRSVGQFSRMAENLTVNPMLPGFAGLNSGIPVGLARQAAGIGSQTTEGSTDAYLKKLSEYGAGWTELGIDRAKVFQNMSAALDSISKTGAVGIDTNSIAKLFDQLAGTGLPGGRTGNMALGMIQGANAASAQLGHDPMMNALMARSMMQHGGLNAKGVAWALGPDALKNIGGENSQQFKDIVNALQGGQLPFGMSLLGNAMMGTQAVNSGLYGSLSQLLGPTGAAVVLQQMTGKPIDVTRGYTGTGAGANARGGGGKYSLPTSFGTGSMMDKLRASAIRYGLNPDDMAKLAGAEGANAPYEHYDVNGPSYGLLQMHKPGLANDFESATGLKASDPANAAALQDYGAWYISQHGTNRKWSSVTSGKVGEPRHTGGSMGSVFADMASLQGAGRRDPRVAKFLKDHGVNLDPVTTAWCAAYLQAAFNMEHISGGKGVTATSWGTFGTGVSASAAVQGDVVVNMRGHQPGQKGGHVGVFTGKWKNGKMEVLAGNTGGGVRTWLADPGDENIRIRHGEGGGISSTGVQTGFRGDSGSAVPHGVGGRQDIQVVPGAAAAPNAEASSLAASAQNITNLGTASEHAAASIAHLAAAAGKLSTMLGGGGKGNSIAAGAAAGGRYEAPPYTGP